MSRSETMKSVRSVCVCIAVLPALSGQASAGSLSVGDLIVADSAPAIGFVHRVLRFNPVTGQHETISSGGSLQLIQDVSMDNNGRVLAADSFSGLVRINPVTGAQTVLASGFSSEGLGDPRRVLALPSDHIIVSTSTGHIVRINPSTGAKTTVAVLAGSARGIARQGNDLIVALFKNQTTGSIVRVNLDTGFTSTITSGDLVAQPSALGLTSDGLAYVINNSNTLVEVDTSTGAQRLVASGGPVIASTELAIGEGDRVFASTFIGLILEIEPNNFGAQTILTAPGENLGQLRAIDYVTVIPSPASAAAIGAAGAGMLLRRRRTGV